MASKGQPKPVMVWLHGGGFSGGNASSYDPRRMVIEGDVVVVTAEFRLNIFGCFGYPGLKDSGAFILLDQQAALGWIKRNIAAFGGDPKNVTLFGESGGAIAACAQLTSPGARSLIHKAILQSGAATTSWPPNTANMGPNASFWRPLKEIETAGEDLAIKMGCPERKGSPEALQWLRDQPASRLLVHSRGFATAAYGGRVLPLNPATALKEGRFNAVPVMSGYNRDEGRALALGMQLMAGGKSMTDDEYRKHLFDAFGERLTEVESQYPRARYASPTLAWSAIYTDRMFACPQLVATRAVARRAAAFAYEFAIQMRRVSCRSFLGSRQAPLIRASFPFSSTSRNIPWT
jgi:para-nitrobenzyl esterase